MTDEEIELIAKKAGIYWVSAETAYMHQDTMRRFADEIASAERERLAMLAESRKYSSDYRGLSASEIREGRI